MAREIHRSWIAHGYSGDAMIREDKRKRCNYLREIASLQANGDKELAKRYAKDLLAVEFAKWRDEQPSISPQQDEALDALCERLMRGESK